MVKPAVPELQELKGKYESGVSQSRIGSPIQKGGRMGSEWVGMSEVLYTPFLKKTQKWLGMWLSGREPAREYQVLGSAPITANK